ncbi:MAG: RusA family crossover junction endodeoxyribonuclease [Pseudomonadota bacterium]
MSDGEALYPLEVVLPGIPVSSQSKTARNREAWKQRVASAARLRQLETYELGFLDDRALDVTIYYFPSDPMEGDIDNIVKPIVDAMIGVAYLDDKIVERVTVQKFEPEGGWEFLAPSDRLAFALDIEPPVVYIRVNDDLSWRRVQ